MAKDPAFLFYPGDYLRDTQTLSEKSQVAYDRIMCEHMRNICISKQQLKFFTKKLNEDELDELMFVLKEIEQGFQIEWVAESIEKRKVYSDSRRKNREGKSNKHMLTYDSHMENENENENENVNKKESKNKNENKNEIIYPFNSEKFLKYWAIWKKYKNDEHKFKYKSYESEQAALKKLGDLSNQNEQNAIDIIVQSIENGWKGFFEFKKNVGSGSDMDNFKKEILNNLLNG